MSDPTRPDQSAADLTRWNRAGLSEFRYIDGNAITIDPALDASAGYTMGNTVIRGNVEQM